MLDADPVRLPVEDTPVAHSAAVSRAGGFSVAAALLQSMRPRQWLKNLLVFAAPLASAAIVHPDAALRAIGAFWVFVAASSSTYLVNDVLDRHRDRLHPVKRHRPIASGKLPPASALAAAAVLAALAVAAGSAIALPLGAATGIYLAISLAYSFWLKRVAIVELACVAFGFTVRAVAGAAATHTPLSTWFLLVTSFGALFVVAGKRTSEQHVLGELGGEHRRTLALYPTEFLRAVRLLAMSVTVTTYCLWAFERSAGLQRPDRIEDLIWFKLSIVPFVLAVLAVELAVSMGRGGEPEQLALSDRKLQLFGAFWVTLTLCGIYA